MSPLATPACSIASITLVINAPFAPSAAAAVALSVWTPKLNSARSGTVLTVPFAGDRDPTAGPWRSPSCARGRAEATPPSATAVSSSAASPAIQTQRLTLRPSTVERPARYGCQLEGIFGAASRMKSTGAGGPGGFGSSIATSSSERSPLRRLHGEHAVTTLSQTDSPPRLRGTTWSRVRRPPLVPQ